ncbi:hypothetical protein PX52LOC_02008 [Limnoglobus roseus]|uniref:Protein kinase domain-containing protein n=1 Tax=Limnoglobus roseus TaxID=2598579 RepID=A0A5C1A8N0_9BACT|nr:hypothetical protein PX52LOC_02008 [Limnoglobus roseus]
MEVNPPRCRVIDLNSRNGTLHNGLRVKTADVVDGDEIGAGHTVFKVVVFADSPQQPPTLDLPASGNLTDDQTGDYEAHPTIPGHKIEGEIGRGGMGIVYRATCLADGKTVALKTISTAREVNRKQIDRFLREARILGELNHPNIVGCREVSEVGGIVYMTMEFVNGSDLESRLKSEGPIDLRTAVRIICQALGGLAHAHARGFVHRDIKPANILVGRDGSKRSAKLADFGLARAYETSKLSGLTMQGEIGGTPLFMSPEQVTHYREVKPAADQYSAAATLYRLLTKQYTHDFPRGIAAQLAHVVSVKPILITARRADIPTELGAVIHKALSQDASDRYPNVMAFRQELKRFA